VESVSANDSVVMPESKPSWTNFEETLRTLLDDISSSLGVPVALLSRDPSGWKFEAEAFPPRASDDARSFRAPVRDWEPDAEREVTDQAGSRWTGLPAGNFKDREWLLMLPGSAEHWSAVPELENVVERIGRSLGPADPDDDDQHFGTLHRRLYGFARRLTDSSDAQKTHRIILKTMAREVRARTGVLALFDEAEQALVIVSTLGYPTALVEHLRIAPGEGILGRVDAAMRRLRYRSHSYIVVPIVVSGATLAVIALTDRFGEPAEFDSRSLASIRLLAAPAGLALARHRLSESVAALTQAASVDSVTGLYNRRHFESQIRAEVQRARRQQQELALLMVDIDDFKRINDTLGHLEGDRALRDVADLLRRGVRIFDFCARYGGEEFAIMMPGATRGMAIQVAERIRRGIHERSRLQPVPITVSVGVGLLGPNQTEEDLIAAADRALISAKRAGKNLVKTE
jgi:diguanylate cyclase (GGDEF)-like protein